MDCRTAQMLAAFTGPGKTELDADQLAALDLHLRQCPQSLHDRQPERLPVVRQRAA